MNKEFLLPDEAAALEGFRDYLLDRERAATTISKYMTDARKLLQFDHCGGQSVSGKSGRRRL